MTTGGTVPTFGRKAGTRPARLAGIVEAPVSAHAAPAFPQSASPVFSQSESPAWSASPDNSIDYQITGQEMQFVELELDPGESAIAEAGAMMFKDAQIEMDSIFGDGSKSSSGFLGRLGSAGRRLITGESLFMTQFTHAGRGKARVAFAAPFPGTIIPFRLADMGGQLIAQKDSFLCAAKGVSIGIFFQRKILTGLFGGEGFIMQKLEGDGYVFVHAGGCIVERDLGPGDELHVDTGCIAAMMPTVDFDIVRAGSVKSMFFGGEGMFFAKLRGPGKVWLQSLPFSRLAGRMLAAAGTPAAGRSNLSEGSSLLGSLASLGGSFSSGDDE